MLCRNVKTSDGDLLNVIFFRITYIEYSQQYKSNCELHCTLYQSWNDIGEYIIESRLSIIQ